MHVSHWDTVCCAVPCCTVLCVVSTSVLQAQPSELELLQAAADSATMGRAQQLLLEEKDEVKHMNQIMRYAKCAAMREQQIQVGALQHLWWRPSHHTHIHIMCICGAASGGPARPGAGDAVRGTLWQGPVANKWKTCPAVHQSCGKMLSDGGIG